MARNYSMSTIKALFAEAQCCAFPDCAEPLVFRDRGAVTVVAEIAHIRSEKHLGPRHDPAYTGDIDGLENLLLLCGKHHRPVDMHESLYTIEELTEWKAKQRVSIGDGVAITDQQARAFVRLSEEERHAIAQIARLAERVVATCDALRDAVSLVELERRRATEAMRRRLLPAWQVAEDGTQTLLTDSAQLPYVEQREWDDRARDAYSQAQPAVLSAVSALREEVAVLRMTGGAGLGTAANRVVLAAQLLQQVAHDHQASESAHAGLEAAIQRLWGTATGALDVPEAAG